MKRILTLLMGASLLAGTTAWSQQGRGRGPRDDDDRGNSGRAAAAAQSSRSGARIESRGASSVQRPTTTTRSTAPSTTTRSDLLRSRSQPTTSTAIRSSSTPSRTITSDSSRVTTSRDRDWSGDRDGRSSSSRDRDWDGDRDRRSYSGSRRHYTRPSSSIYRNWDRNRVYSWNNNRWRWYGGTWVIYDVSPTYYSGPISSGSVVADVQAELRQRGFYRGSVDGVSGPMTRSAIASFQRSRGLAATGRINETLLRALGLI